MNKFIHRGKQAVLRNIRRVPPASLAANTAINCRATPNFGNTSAERTPRNAGRPMHHLYAAFAQNDRAGRCDQAFCPFIQVFPQEFKFRPDPVRVVFSALHAEGEPAIRDRATARAALPGFMASDDPNLQMEPGQPKGGVLPFKTERLFFSGPMRSDNGPEFVSLAILRWITEMGVETALCDPGKPWQNGTDESFNGKFRDECLSLEWFRSRAEAIVVIESWRQHYNEIRPHSSLGYLTPNEHKQQLLRKNNQTMVAELT